MDSIDTMGMGRMRKKIKRICRDDDFSLLLGDDILILVLLQLPMLSLLRFKSVCKYWHTLIESSFFTHLLHTSSSSSSSNFGTLILQASVGKYKCTCSGRFEKKVESEIITLSSESESMSRIGSKPRSGSSGWCWSTDEDYDQLNKLYGSNDDDDGSSKEDDDHMFKVDNLMFKLNSLGLPSAYKFSLNRIIIPSIVMVGSCNGLICLYDKEHQEVTLWNPATRRSRILPKHQEKSNGYGGTTEFCVGFGFDVKTKDYKVVLLSFLPQPQLLGYGNCLVQVYTLSTDSWRVLEGIHSLPGRPQTLHHGLYMNGSCFLMATYNFPSGPPGYNRWFLISFNFTKEIITTMEYPDRRHDHTTQGFFLTHFGDDKMALFIIRVPQNDYYDYYDCDIWVLDEHGMNNESWTKLHSFQIKKRVDEHIIPRGISNNGEFALLESRGGMHGCGLNRKMKLFNLVTKETKMVFLSCNLVMSRALVYKPSIVSIMGGNRSQA